MSEQIESIGVGLLVFLALVDLDERRAVDLFHEGCTSEHHGYIWAIAFANVIDQLSPRGDRRMVVVTARAPADDPLAPGTTTDNEMSALGAIAAAVCNKDFEGAHAVWAGLSAGEQVRLTWNMAVVASVFARRKLDR